MIVIDTTVVTELMRPSPATAVLAWVRAQPRGELHTSAVTVAEVRYTLERLPQGARRDRLRAVADEVFTEFSDYVLPFDAAAAVHYAHIVAYRDGLRQPINALDAQVAAICRAHGAALAARHGTDFAETGITVIDPWLPA
jgi:predicted nucleic acid-binding protein